MKPEVSVIISTHNRPEKLERAIKSVQAQTHKNWELIVADDCSTNATKELVALLMKEDSRIKYLRLEKPHGKDTKPKNQGILASVGEYITYLDDDNAWYPSFLADQLDYIKSSEADVVYCDMLLFDDENPDAAPQQAISMPFDAQVLMRKNYIDTSEVLHKRDCVFAVGGWDETLPRFVDWNLWVRMTKAGFRFEQNKKILLKYYVSTNNSATKHPVRVKRDPILGTLFEPTFDPAGCHVWLPYLGERTGEVTPRVAIFTLSYDRKDYTTRMWESLNRSTKYPFDWFVLDQGSTDGSVEYLESLQDSRVHLIKEKTNLGITRASNKLLEEILPKNYDIIIKIDNDCEFLTKDWLESLIDLWKRNHVLYISPYVEGLVDNPGGAQRVGVAYIGPYMVEVTLHIGGIFAFISAKAYANFRWTDQFLHGDQDTEASIAFRELGYMPCYLPLHRVSHMDTTSGQKQKYPEYFERRKTEKTKTYDE